MAVLVLAAGCGGDGGRRDGPDDADAVTSFTIVARGLRWDTDRIVVPAGQEIRATVDNRDRDIPHNLHVKAPGGPKSALEEGPVTQTLRFTIDTPGHYEFVCDAHLTMTGAIQVV